MDNNIKTNGQIQIRIDTATKENARKILNNLGLDISTAIKTFLRQVIIVGGLPYELRDINGYTKKEIAEINASYQEAVKYGKRFKTIKEALKNLYE